MIFSCQSIWKIDPIVIESIFNFKTEKNYQVFLFASIPCTSLTSFYLKRFKITLEKLFCLYCKLKRTEKNKCISLRRFSNTFVQEIKHYIYGCSDKNNVLHPKNSSFQVLSLTLITCSRITFSFGVLSFFRKNWMNLVVSEILIWSTSSKLRTYDRDVSFAGLRTSYYCTNFSYHTE